MKKNNIMDNKDMILVLIAIFVIGIGFKSSNIINDKIENEYRLSNDIQDIINNSDSIISIPGKTYKITEGLELKSGIYEGVSDKTIIYVSDDFKEGNSKPSDEFAIYNKNFSLNYNNNADDITIKNVTFILENKKNQSTISTLLGFANIKKLLLENCKIIVRNDFKLEQCGFDFYAANKNVIMKDCYVEISTLGESGGNWIRNCSEDYSGNSTSENIIIDNCIFKTTSKDEILAIYGWKNTMKNVNVQNCKFLQESDGNKLSMLISVFGSDREPHLNKNGCIKNVYFDANQFEVSNVDAFVIQVGNDGLEGIVDNIMIANSEIKVHCNLVAAVRGYSYCKNTTIENSKFYFDDDAEITMAVYTIENAINNIFTGGKLTTCLEDVKNVVSNTCKNSNLDVFARDCQNITDNIVLGSILCDLYYSDNITIIKNNVFTSSKTKIDVVKVTYNSEEGDRNIFIGVEDNSINLKSTKNRLAWSNNAGSYFGFKNNIITNAKKGVIVYPGDMIVYDENNSKNGKVQPLNS